MDRLSFPNGLCVPARLVRYAVRPSFAWDGWELDFWFDAVAYHFRYRFGPGDCARLAMGPDEIARRVILGLDAIAVRVMQEHRLVLSARRDFEQRCREFSRQLEDSRDERNQETRQDELAPGVPRFTGRDCLDPATAECKAAERKAADLLANCLSADQRAEFERSRSFHVEVPRCRRFPAGGRVRIEYSRTYNVVDEERQFRLCATPEGRMPIEDVMLAQKLVLENCPDVFFDKANPQPVRDFAVYNEQMNALRRYQLERIMIRQDFGVMPNANTLY